MYDVQFLKPVAVVGQMSAPMQQGLCNSHTAAGAAANGSDVSSC